MSTREKLLQSLAALGVKGTVKVFTDIEVGTFNLIEAGFTKRLSSTGRKQYVTVLPDNTEIIINVSDYNDNDTYKIIKRTANINYKSMLAGDFFLIGL